MHATSGVLFLHELSFFVMVVVEGERFELRD